MFVAMLLQEVVESVVDILPAIVCAQTLDFVTEFVFSSGFEQFEVGKDLALFFEQVGGGSVSVVIDEGNEVARAAKGRSAHGPTNVRVDKFQRLGCSPTSRTRKWSSVLLPKHTGFTKQVPHSSH